MIELRWLKRSTPPGFVLQDSGRVFYMVLQWRLKPYASIMPDGKFAGMVEPEWQDVKIAGDV